MNKLLIAVLCAAMTFPAVSLADDYDGRSSRSPSYRHGSGQQHDRDRGRSHHDRENDRGDHRYNNGGRYPYYVRNARHHHYRGYAPYYYRNSYPYYYNRNHHNGDDDDEALWAIGGLVVGAIIGNAVANASTSPASPPPQNCDHVAYDSSGNPYVERSCAK